MQKIISCRVTDEYVQGTGAVVGAAGSHDDAALELSFSEIWNGTTKRIVWFDALGQNPTLTILTPQLLVPGEEEVYRVPIPAEAKAVAGNLMMSIRGVVVGDDGYEDKAVVSATAEFVVLESVWDNDASESEEITPSQAEQLQAELDSIKTDISATVEAAKKLEEYVDTTDKNAKAAALAEENAKDAQAAAAASATASSNAASLAGTNAANAAKSAAEAKQAAANANGVLTFNGRKGSVVPQKGDYSVAMITGAVPETRKINGKPLTSDITLTAEEMAGAVPITRKVNGKALSSDITLTAADVGAVNKAGDTMRGTLSIQPNGVNAYSQIYKNATSDESDWGTLVIDRDATNAMYGLKLRAAAKQARITDGVAEHDIYHTGNKPTAADVGAVCDGGEAPDIDNHVATGIFRTNGNSAGTFPYEMGERIGVLIHKTWDVNYREQVLFGFTTGGMYHRIMRSSVWGAWEKLATTDYALARDGSNSMTGDLNIAIPNKARFGLIPETSGVRVQAYTADWNKRKFLWMPGEGSTAPYDKLQYVDMDTTNGKNGRFDILHTGNKPSGSYVGTGEARTIDIGGFGNALLVWNEVMAAGTGKTTPNYTIVFPIGAKGATSSFSSDEVKFESGKLTFALNPGSSCNAKGATYYYQVL